MTETATTTAEGAAADGAAAQKKPAAPAPQGALDKPSNAYSYYVLGLLFVVYIFNFIDRQIVTALVQPLKEEFGVSDSALGFLTGTAFALFYATMGMPIARLADRHARRTIIAIALALWSGMTALCGLATAFWQLALFRIGVAVGEAGASPPSHSLISDYFSPRRRATALAVYSLGIPIGGTLGLMIGAAISEWYDWRLAFLIVGLPGLALAVLVRYTIREPKRGGTEEREVKVEVPPLSRVVEVLRTRKSFFHLSLGSALHAFVGYGLAAFNPAFIERVWDVSRAELGFKLGIVAGIAGALGVFAGGWISDYLAKWDRRWYMWVPAIAMLISFPFYLAVYTTESFNMFLVLIVLPSFMGNLYTGPVFASTQSMVPVGMRAVAAAILLFVINIIGLGLGPQMVGVLSDIILPYTEVNGQTSSGESLRWALVLVALFKFQSGFHYLMAARTLRQDLDAASKD